MIRNICLIKWVKYPILLIGLVNMCCLLTAEITSELEVFKVQRDAAGVETLVEVSEVKPGDIVEYRAHFTNEGETNYSQLNLEIPVPQETTFVPFSETPRADVLILRDDSTLTYSDTAFESDSLVPETVAGVRWSVDRVAPSETIELTLRAQVSE